MRTLFIDCSSGASGDMLAAALYGLLDDKDGFIDTAKNLGIPDVDIVFSEVSKCGIVCNDISVRIKGIEEGHGHHHEHHSLVDVDSVIDGMNVPDRIKSMIGGIYARIAEAESEAHGVPVSEVHFHEIGAKDAIADIALSCLLFSTIGADKVIASPIRVGKGTVHCSHGTVPVPAPATESLLKGIPCYSGDTDGEFCTPTGAAILSYFVDEFSEMPVMSMERTSRGAGKRDMPTANYLRACVGRTSESTERICELECNIDDMTSEDLAHSMEVLLEAGALDVYTAPINMKKGRPAHLLVCACRLSDRERLASVIFAETTTAGIRMIVKDRYVLSRHIEERTIDGATVRVKVYEGFGVVREKPEYEDLKRISSETGESTLSLRARFSRKG